MRCPVCRATVEQGPQCRRCRADLSVLFRLEEQREEAVRAARGALARGDADEALEWAEAAAGMRPGADAERLRATGHLLRREFAAAWQRYLAARVAEQGE